MSFARLAQIWPELANVDAKVAAQVEIDARYDAYVRRQDVDVASLRKDEGTAIPSDFDYTTLASLKAELRQKLETLRPATLAQAGRIEGMTPAALMLILAHVKKSAATARKRAS
jgi:tRNA uridine 5-carboxymethylaminomethyl modification enzyme